ncbi:hypothetical protein WME94_53800 [Sorangium sp. So ce429]
MKRRAWLMSYLHAMMSAALRPLLVTFPAILILLTVASGCGEHSSPKEEPRAGSSQALFGQDGALTVSEANTIINRYAELAVDAPAGSTSISVTEAADLTLAPGDLIMVIQMQGATINTTDTKDYGAITALNGAGHYELVAVSEVIGNTINLGCSDGLRNSYIAASKTQIVRVPQYTTLTVTATGSITSPPWNGNRGGIVAVHVVDTVTLDGPIDVSGKGFRGGDVDNSTVGSGNWTQIGYRSNEPQIGGEKGESVAGYRAGYELGRYGRGAPANGGGGGNGHNAGGGGGANGKFGDPWTGQGVMDTSYANAWELDPAYINNSHMLTSSEGGGRGGYSFSSELVNPLDTGPDNSAWSGDERREVGGLGGRPMSSSASDLLFFGGGGGAGDGNNGFAGAGGRGGGIALLIASNVAGASGIYASGEDGRSSTPGSSCDGAGGGGGGGTILVGGIVASTVSLEANGGSGGNETNATQEACGPGGGGGGGYIHADASGVGVSGGPGGLSSSTTFSAFPGNGATSGNRGEFQREQPLFSVCCIEALDADSDDDGALDCEEPAFGNDIDGDDLIGALDPDSDGDGIFDGTELGLDCENEATNTEAGHCRADVDGGATKTSPVDVDTDGGGVRDGQEDINLDGAVDAGETDPNDGDDDLPIDDTDGDGLVDELEDLIGSDPEDADSDDDGALDGQEPNFRDDHDRDGDINTLDPDSDGDGLFDGTEVGLDCSNPATDAGAGSCIPDADPQTTTNPLDPDTDDGGVSDGVEDANHNGAINAGETDPNNGDDDTPNVDTDDDDDDDDGLSDGAEEEIGTNPNDADSDDDGIFDGTEMGLDCSTPGTDAAAHQCIVDADLGATTTNPLEPDTDRGGVSDGSEDTNRNGLLDPGETDPNNAADDRCDSDAACPYLFECGREHRCVPLTEGPLASKGLCAASAAGAPTPGGAPSIALLALLALLARGRRARR